MQRPDAEVLPPGHHARPATALALGVSAATAVATDWLAVAIRADHRLWNHTTRWLIAALVPDQRSCWQWGVRIVERWVRSISQL